MPSAREYIETLAAAATRLAQAVTNVEFWHERLVTQAQTEHDQKVAAATNRANSQCATRAPSATACFNRRSRPTLKPPPRLTPIISGP